MLSYVMYYVYGWKNGPNLLSMPVFLHFSAGQVKGLGSHPLMSPHRF